MIDLTLDSAARAINAGDIIVIPTETVYGLAADARDPAAVEKLFKAKGRPASNPIACLIADAEAALDLCPPPPDGRAAVERLQRFWPGPLTLLLPHHDLFPDNVTAGSPFVGLRVPDHDLTRELLGLLGRPLAVTSANRSGAPSPTTVGAARLALAHSEIVAGALDGGACRLALESTVVQPAETNGTPAIKILREGALKIADFNDIGIRVL